MQNVTVSVIVPVYNARAYLDPCVKSVLSQSFQDMELILVDDGSTDGSLGKCRFWETDPRVRVISTENRGVSHARNVGLQKACGKWILFLDSDDFLLDNCLENLLATVSPETQAVIASYVSGEAGPEKLLHQSVDADAVIRMSLDGINNRLFPDFYEGKPLALTACWSKLFLNEVIRKNAIRFHEDLRLSEDTLFNLEYLACIDRAVVSNLPVTFYRVNTSSVTKVFRAEHLANRFLFFDLLKERQYPDAPVHIVSLLFFEICKIERLTKGRERNLLETEIAGYLSNNDDVLHSVKKRSLSKGKWQGYAYAAAAFCFRRKLFWAGFRLLRIYGFLTQGEINKLTAKE